MGDGFGRANGAFGEMLTSAADEGEPRCARCGYILKGLTSARCPECGANLALVLLSPERQVRNRIFETAERGWLLNAYARTLASTFRPASMWMQLASGKVPVRPARLALVVAGGFCCAVFVLLGLTLPSAYVARRVLRSAAVTGVASMRMASDPVVVIRMASDPFWWPIQDWASPGIIGHNLLVLSVPLASGLLVVAASVWLRARSPSAFRQHFLSGLRLASYILPPVAMVWAVSLVIEGYMYAIWLSMGWSGYSVLVLVGLLVPATTLWVYLAIPMKLYFRLPDSILQSGLAAGVAVVSASGVTLAVLMASRG